MTDTGKGDADKRPPNRTKEDMTITLKPLQAITNAPEVYDYGWMKTVVENVAVDEKGRPCRLVQNEDEWHFRQQLLRYQSGLHLAIDDQKRLDEFFRYGWLKMTDSPVRIHRLKIDLDQAIGWDDSRRDALIESLDQWRDRPDIRYTTGHGMDYYIECRGDEAAERVRAKLGELRLAWEPWGPQPE